MWNVPLRRPADLVDGELGDGLQVSDFWGEVEEA
jgi:hypothetical protein